MAEEEAEETEAPSGGGGKKKLLIMIIAGVVILAGLGGGAAFFLAGSDSAPEPAEEPSEAGEGEEKASEEDEEKDEEKGSDGEGGQTEEEGDQEKAKEDKESDINFGATYPFKPFHLNLGNPLENRYLRLEIALEYRQGESQKAEIDARLPQLRDAVISVATRKTREFLLGPDGKDQLRLEILTRVNQYMDMKIDSVFITDLLIE